MPQLEIIDSPADFRGGNDSGEFESVPLPNHPFRLNLYPDVSRNLIVQFPIFSYASCGFAKKVAPIDLYPVDCAGGMSHLEAQ